MAIIKLFSERRREMERAGEADVYQYANVPSNLRVQVSQIAIEGIGYGHLPAASYGASDPLNDLWEMIEDIFLREKGVNSVGFGKDPAERVIKFMSECGTEDWLDIFELVCRGITIAGEEKNEQFRKRWRVKVKAVDAIEEINHRLRRAGLGYQIEDNQLFRVDSQFIHAEVVKPALQLLADEAYAGPRQEFESAHQHYRSGDYKQAVAQAANALESTFKAVFDQKTWAYPKNARISDLVKVAKGNELWPTYLDNSFDQLLATLQNGLPKIRDNDAAHGQGAIVREVPNYVAAYALHLCASKIVFIVEAANAA